MKTKFTVEYDDQIEEVVEKVSDALKDFGLSIEISQNEDDDEGGCVTFEIYKLVKTKAPKIAFDPSIGYYCEKS